MTDYCLQNADQAELDGLLLLTGLGVESEGQVISASSDVLLDRIGPITRQTGTDANGEPIYTVYPEYYSNLRLLTEPSAEQVAALAAYTVDPSQPQYRVFL